MSPADIASFIQLALRKVSELEGLLPMCASCRKVRDDGGYWGQIEDYFTAHAPIEFTHSICPDCMGTLYSDLHDGRAFREHDR